MEFKTNINCGGCIAKATPALDQVAGTHQWSVNTAHPEKILTITSNVAPSAIVAALQAAGFKASVKA